MKFILLLVVVSFCICLSVCNELSLTRNFFQQDAHETALGGEPFNLWEVLSAQSIYETQQSSTTNNPDIHYEPYDNSRVVISRNWPQNLADVSLWVGYGAYLIMVFLSPIVILIVLCNVTFYFWCCRKLKVCGGSKPIDTGYPISARRKLLVPIDIIFILISILTIIAIICSALFSVGVNQVMGNTFNTTDTVFDNVNNLFNFTFGIVPMINKTVSEANVIASYIPQFNTPLQDINNDVGNAINELELIRADMNKIANATANAQTKVYWLQQQPALSNVPPISAVPTPSIDNQNMINNAEDQLRNTQNTIASTENTISNATSMFQGPLNSAISSAVSTAQPIINDIQQPLQQLMNYKQQYFSSNREGQVKYYVNMVETIRVVITCVLVSIAMIMYGIMLLIVYPCNRNTKAIFQITSCLTWFTAWIPIIIGSFSITIWAFGTDVCRNAEPAAYAVLNATGVTIQNTSLANIAQEVLQCSGNQNLLSIIGFDFNNTFNFNQLESQINSQLQNGLNKFDINSTLANARANINQFKNQSNSVNLDYSAQLASISASMGNLTEQLSDLNRFGFNMTAYQDSLNNLNDYTYNVTNGTYTYSFENVTQLNPNLPPYNSSASIKNGVQTRLNVVLSYQTAYNSTIDLISQIRANLSSINGSLADIQSNLTDAQSIQNTLLNVYPNLLNSRLDDLSYLTNNLTANVTAIANNIIGLVNKAINAVEGILGCGYIGSNYSGTKNTFCVSMLGYIGVTGLSLTFIGILMFIMFFFLILGTKYFGYKSDIDNNYSPSTSPMSGGQVELQDEEKHHTTTHYPLARDDDSE
jgi:hypothetical protein